MNRKALLLAAVTSLSVVNLNAALLVRELWDNVGNGVIGGTADGTSSMGFEPGYSWYLNTGTYIKVAGNFDVTEGSPDTIPGLPYSGSGQGGLWGDYWTPGGGGIWDNAHWATRQLASPAQPNLGVDGEYWISVRINNGGDSAGGIGLASAGDATAEFIGAGAMWNNAGGGSANNSIYIAGGILSQPGGPYAILANSGAGTINGKGLLVARLTTSATGSDTISAAVFLPGSTLPPDASGITWQTTFSFSSSMTATHLLLWMNGTYPFEMDAIYIGNSYAEVAAGPIFVQNLTVTPGTNVYAGVPLSFAVNARGIGTLGYQWRKNGEIVAVSAAGNFNLPNPAVTDSGNYDVVVTNAAGAITSSVVSIVVNPANPPVLTSELTPLTPTRSIRGYVRFSAGVDGTPPFTYQWKHAGTNLPGATNAVLFLDDLTVANAGGYSLAINNAFGSTNTATGTLSIVTPVPGSYEEMIVTNKPIAYWRLNEGTNPYDTPLVAYEYMGGYDAFHTNVQTLEGIRPPAYLEMEPTNNAAYYNGTSASSTTASLMNNLARFTLMGWFNPNVWPQETALGSGRVALFGQNDASEFGFHGTNIVGMWTPGGGFVSFDASTLITAQNWYFIVAVGNGSNITFYLNGNQAAQSAVTTTNYGSSAYPFRIGYGVLDAAANEFNGLIDEVALFDRALSVEEVNALYGSAVGVAQPPLVLVQPTGTTRYAGQSATFNVTAGGTLPLHYQWRHDGGTILGATNSSLVLSNLTALNAGSYDVVITNRAGGATSSFAGLTVIVPTSGSYEQQVVGLAPVAYYRLNEAAWSTIAHDYWGGFHGTIQPGAGMGLPGPTNPPFLGFESTNTSLAIFNGVADSWVSCPALNLYTNTVTISAWVYAEGGQGGWRGIVFSRAGNTTAGIHTGDGNELRYTWNNTGDTYGWNSGLQIPVGQWCFVAAVIEPSQATLYVGDASGIRSATHAATHAIEEFNGNTLIGRDSGAATSRIWNGSIDEVMILKRALPAPEILALYQKAIPVQPGLSLAVANVVVPDTKPSGTPFNGLNLHATRLENSTDSVLRTRTGVMEFVETNRSQIVIGPETQLDTPKGSVSFWIRTGDTEVNNGAMIIDRRGGNGEILVVGTGGLLNWQPSWVYADSTTLGVADGNWHHLVYVYDQSAAGYSSVYLDGNLDKTHVNPGAWTWDNRPIEIGFSHDGYWDGFNGQLDDIRFYNRELSASEISQIFNGDSPIVGGADLTGRYNFDTGLLPGLELRWQIGTLEAADEVAGPYTPVAGATSPWPVNPNQAKKFYRTKL